MQIYPQDTITNLEFDKVIDLLKKRCVSSLGVNWIDGITFNTDVTSLQIVLSKVHEFKSILDANFPFPSSNYIDLKEEVHALEIPDYVLSEQQLSRVRTHQDTLASIFKFFKKYKEEYDTLRGVLKDNTYEEAIKAEIDSIIDANDTVRSDASDALQKIRKQIISKRIELDKVFKQIASRYRKKDYLTDTQESIRNGRRVLTVLAEYKRQIKGIVHDESDSGKTTYIEPQETVFINNEIFELELEEKREIYKILKELSQKIREHLPLILAYQSILGEIDFIRAKALIAVDTDASMPKLNKGTSIKLINAFHPLLFLLNEKAGKETIPLNIELSKEHRILVISGPNAGGKSVSLKTIGLNQLMLQAGMLIPVDESSEMGVFTNLFSDLGDAQSLEDELSTYSSRLTRMREFLKNSDNKTLFLIDEFGTGTDPMLGGAMAQAILQALNEQKTTGVVTTHYGNLKEFAEKTDGIFNGSMQFDESNLSPTYKLVSGQPGRSYTFEIAKNTGLPKDVISEAKKLAGNKSIQFESLLDKVQKDKQNLDEGKQTVEDENKRLKQLIQKFERQTKELELQKKQLKHERKVLKLEELGRIDSKVREVLKEIKKNKDSEKAAKEVQTKLNKERNDITKEVKTLHKEVFVKEVEGDIEVGSNVRLISNDKQGIVEEIRKNKAMVSFGMLRTQVKLEDLILVEKEKSYINTNKPRKMDVRYEQASVNIDLRGKTSEEAFVELERFLDSALMQNQNEVRILHGKGTGRLRDLVKNTIKEYKDVKEFYHPKDYLGGDGITIIKFK